MCIVLRTFSFARKIHRTAFQHVYPQVHVNKNLSLADEPIDISVSGLTPSQPVTLHASTSLPNGASFESLGHYVADGSGHVDLSKEESLGGTYEGLEPMGPFWSMVPSLTNKRKHERFVVLEPKQPFSVNMSVHKGVISDFRDITNNSAIAETTIERTYMASGVQEYEVKEGKVRGTLYLPAGDGPFPGVLSMSGGAVPSLNYKAALLASKGYAALSLRYFGSDDLPDEVLVHHDLDYFEEAALYLKRHPRVRGEGGIGIVANCLGGIIALALASVAPDGLIKCVVAINCWFHSSEIFHYKNRSLFPGRVYTHEFKKNRDDLVFMDYDMTLDLSDPMAYFRFNERRDIPYLLVFGGDDGYYDTKTISVDAYKLFEMAGHENYKILYYPDAGHLLEHAFHPLGRIVWSVRNFHLTGGVQPGHAKAEIDSWPQVLDFVHENMTVG